MDISKMKVGDTVIVEAISKDDSLMKIDEAIRTLKSISSNLPRMIQALSVIHSQAIKRGEVEIEDEVVVTISNAFRNFKL